MKIEIMNLSYKMKKIKTKQQERLSHTFPHTEMKMQDVPKFNTPIPKKEELWKGPKGTWGS